MSPIQILGYLLIAFGVVDFAGQFLDYDLTGVSWSPIVAGVVGVALTSVGDKGE